MRRHEGLDSVAINVANLVAQTFAAKVSPEQSANDNQTPHRRGDEQPFAGMAPPGLLSHLLRTIGLDGSKIGAMAVNGIIFIAQMVSEGMYALSLYMRQNLWDWWVILKYVAQRVLDSHRPPTPPSVETFGAGW